MKKEAQEEMILNGLFSLVVCLLGLFSLFCLMAFLILGLSIAEATVQAYGYCSKTQIIMTKEQKLHHVINEINQDPKVTFETFEPYSFTKEKRVSYADVADFMAKNPDCCSITSTSFFEKFYSWFGGTGGSHIHIKYNAFSLNAAGEAHSTPKDIHIHADACGDFLHPYE